MNTTGKEQQASVGIQPAQSRGVNVIPNPKKTPTELFPELSPTGGTREEAVVEFIPRNWLAAQGMTLRYVVPTIKNGETVVELCEDEIESETVWWKKALILYVVGADQPLQLSKGILQPLGTTSQNLR